MKYLVALIFILAIPALGQYHTIREDTITTGNGNEFHPALSRGVKGMFYANPIDWLVFDRQTEDSSYIIAKKISNRIVLWDSSEVIITRTSVAESQSSPDICWDGTSGLIAWQKRTGTKSDIFYSSYSPTTQTWSAAHQLTSDTLDNVQVRIREASGDSQFIVAWQNRNIVRMRSFPNGLTNENDTIAVSNNESVEFDLRGPVGINKNGFLYTIKNGDSTDIVIAECSTTPGGSAKILDTLMTSMLIDQPRFVEGQSSQYQITFESPGLNEAQRRIFYAVVYTNYPSQLFEIAGADSGFSYRNARSFMFPVMTGVAAAQRMLATYQVVAAECYDTTDSTDTPSIVILQGAHRDSISSVGYNRRPTIGASMFYSYPGYSVPIVWESNRSGKNHLYGFRYVSYYSLGVGEEQYSPRDFRLMQNYPNPFNPSTTIGYELARASHVTLKVFNVLGEEVATLLNETQSAGVHQCQFSSEAKRLSSGVYFYRLQAGNFMQTRSMIVLK